jgi:D-lyxose ketol-isomerase
MISQKEYAAAVENAVRMLKQCGMIITTAEESRFEVADFGLGELQKTGLQVITYVNTDRVCAKEIVMFPRQTCPEHWHPTIGQRLGKEETFRCRWGTVYLYVPGAPAARASCAPPAGSEAYYKAPHEVVLRPGEQYTMWPDTPHWFQAGPEGAIVSEFSTRSTDDEDRFTDPRIKRAPEIQAK